MREVEYPNMKIGWLKSLGNDSILINKLQLINKKMEWNQELIESLKDHWKYEIRLIVIYCNLF